MKYYIKPEDLNLMLNGSNIIENILETAGSGDEIIFLPGIFYIDGSNLLCE